MALGPYSGFGSPGMPIGLSTHTSHWLSDPSTQRRSANRQVIPTKPRRRPPSHCTHRQARRRHAASREPQDEKADRDEPADPRPVTDRSAKGKAQIGERHRYAAPYEKHAVGCQHPSHPVTRYAARYQRAHEHEGQGGGEEYVGGAVLLALADSGPRMANAASTPVVIPILIGIQGMVLPLSCPVPQPHSGRDRPHRLRHDIHPATDHRVGIDLVAERSSETGHDSLGVVLVRLKRWSTNAWTRLRSGLNNAAAARVAAATASGESE